MNYILYKITNLINNKIYIGMHRTYDINDGYMGSGKILKRAIKKNGIENFKKEILFIFDNEKEMSDKEAEIVNEDFCKKDDNYNIATGGSGGDTLTFNPNINEIKKKMSEKGKGKIPWNKGIPRTDEVKKAVSLGNKGKKTWNEGINHINGYKWMTDGKLNTRIPKEKIIEYENLGYKIGRTCSEKLIIHLKKQNEKRKIKEVNYGI
jgi:hypothetical protein